MEKDKLLSKPESDRDWELITALDLAIKALEIAEASTVDTTRKIQSKLISEVCHSIARQFSEHNEVVPFWLSIGDIRIKESENE